MQESGCGGGLQGWWMGEFANQNTAAYARDRRQGRAVAVHAEPDEKAYPIIVHPDVRRMLMEARAFVEGGRALSLWAALLVDLSRHAASEEERQQADDLVSLLTPVIKGYLTDMGYETATKAQRSEEHTSELQSLMRISYAVFCLKKTN